MTPYHIRIRTLFGFPRRPQRVMELPQRQGPRMTGPHERAVARVQRAARRMYGGPRRRRTAVLLLLLLPLLTGFGALALARILSKPSGSEVVKTVEIVKEMEKPVVLPEQRDPPILRKIATCESQNTHYDRQGNVLRGKLNKYDIGKYQINTALWGHVATQQGYDLYNEQGNEQMAHYLLDHYGTLPWRRSAACWARK
jgi:hypothetical protein